jgi:hypothetical protein
MRPWRSEGQRRLLTARRNQRGAKRLSFGDGLTWLRKQEEKAGRKDRPERLPPTALDTVPAVFQPRLAEQEFHVKELARAIRSQPAADRVLDPVLVAAFGRKFVCIDGHHRLLAYAEAGLTEPIPVEYFEGTLEDAMREAALRNSKDRLPMTNEEKLEAAWRLVQMGKHSKADMAKATGASQRTIATMRKVLAQLHMPEVAGDWGGGRTIPETWKEARGLLSADEAREFTDEAREAQVRDWARRIGRHFGNRVSAQPDVFADAIALFSRGLPRSLIDSWREEAEEAVAAWAEDDEDADPNFQSC